jgi:hypothetical protein
MQPDHPSDEGYPSRGILHNAAKIHECEIACRSDDAKLKKLILDAFLGNKRAMETERAFPECVATAFFVIVPGQEPVPWNLMHFMRPKPGHEHFVMAFGNEIAEAFAFLEEHRSRTRQQTRDDADGASAGHGLPSSSDSP